MDQIAISKFKATCLGDLERVNKTREPILVTCFGKPVATIMPSGIAHPVPRFGTGIGSAEILGEVDGCISDETDWEAAQDPESAE